MNLPDCPTPTQKYDRIVMAHGGGGRMTSRLIEKIFYPAFQNKWLEQAHDGATLNLPSARIAITTDSFVVDPLFFPGGNIGDLAINGTVNDLLCCGASLSAINAENQQIVKQAPNFTPKSVKLGAFVLYLRFILENRDTTNVIG